MNALSSQAIATSRQPTPVESYTLQVIGDETVENELWRALPAHIRPDRFKRNLVNLLMQSPDIMKYEPRYVYREVSKAAALGLLLDPQLGEAYIVPVWNAKAGRAEPQLRVGYRGLIKLARQSGEIKRIYAHEVHENDIFECELGTQKTLTHKPNLRSDRGEICLYYAVVHYADGETDFEPMTVEQVLAIRDRSDAWRAYMAKKIKSTPWATDECEMAKKTVLRRILKRIPQSPELSDALSIENTADAITTAQPVPRGTSFADSLRMHRTSITQSLDAFASRDEEPVTEIQPRPATSEAATELSAPSSNALARPDDGADTPTPCQVAHASGRDAFNAGRPRSVPRDLNTKARKAEAEAFLAGYDEASDPVEDYDGIEY